ncbi:ATP-dependent helicase [Mycobacterium sp. MYCO198283]|uniref:ATP-dependent helicase n=1 Tax=Mycobacterium sp. MYCO198283 TaxID=2883505 RepID=UPI001E2D9E40|nr:ATP-dependent DNA helicase [Mycobacterium sp. MYCO198283]MCG5431566.1 ATP-dependent helicase [Mycobacterium sp. MYCO198283]
MSASPVAAPPPRSWDPPVRALFDPALRGTHRVVGGPGTGKSTLLLDIAAARLGAGTDPGSVLLLTGSARQSARLRGALSAAVLGGGVNVVTEPLVRSVHSYAFAVLRRAAHRNGDPPPRLVTAAEQDAVIRELLATEEEQAAWPATLRPALRTAGFAAALRELLARCAERGIDDVELRRIGLRAGQPMWVAAARFARQYEQIMLLRAAVGTAAPQATVPALGAAELVGGALEALAVDPDLLAAERARLALLLVDDAQQLDPQAALLVRTLAAGRDAPTVIAGDPTQAVFGFRGADARLLAEPGALVLSRSHRCAPAIAAAVSAVAARLPRSAPGRHIDGTGEAGAVGTRLAATPQAEAAIVADALRRAHLVDGVPWSELAVVVRSVPRAAAVLPRALAAAGIPVITPPPPAAGHPAVEALLTVLRATLDGLTADQAVSLVTGPLGRVDPVTLRQLHRALRRARAADGPRDIGALLVAALTDDPGAVPAAAALRRLRGVLGAAGRSAATGDDPRYTLWLAWQRSGLQRRWLTTAGRGGAAGAAADQALDAVTALFDVAEQYVSRTAGATLRGLLDHVEQLSLTTPVGEPAAVPDAVTLTSVHGALGREWDTVVVAGLQDGLWPNVAPRGGILATQRLLDLLDGVDDAAVSDRAPLLAEERRLLVAALGRARRRVLVTAVDSDAGEQPLLPSAFFTELAALVGREDAPPPVEPAPRVLAPVPVVGRLRAVVCAPAGAVDDAQRARAATQLARLAAAGVPGADPSSWYGSRPVSTCEPLRDADEVVPLSPSTLQTLVDCPLRWLVERHGGSDRRDVRSALGTVLHALVADGGRSEQQLLAELESVWDAMPFDAAWYARHELTRHQAMLSTFAQWWAQTRHELTEVGREIDVDGVLHDPDGALPDVRVRGRLDRLERDAQGRLVIVDVKTGKTPATKDEAQRHAQLALYQLAVAAGLLPDGDIPGGGRLVYVAKPSATGATERHQDPLTPETAAAWRRQVHAAAAASLGPQFTARVNKGCTHCPMRTGCPAHAGTAAAGDGESA